MRFSLSLFVVSVQLLCHASTAFTAHTVLHKKDVRASRTLIRTRATRAAPFSSSGCAEEDPRSSSRSWPSSAASTPRAGRRMFFRRVLGTALVAAGAVGTAQTAAWAAGPGAVGTLAVPAFVPSPLRPTGDMAKICNVVALGRDDVCLDPKKLPSAYDKILLGQARDTMDGDAAPARKKAVLLLAAVSNADWSTCEQELTAAAAEGILPKNKATQALQKACQSEDGPTAAKAVLELVKKL